MTRQQFALLALLGGTLALAGWILWLRHKSIKIRQLKQGLAEVTKLTDKALAGLPDQAVEEPHPEGEVVDGEELVTLIWDLGSEHKQNGSGHPHGRQHRGPLR